MRLAVMSDTHDQIPNLRRAVAMIRAANCDLIVHCGDFVAPFMLPELDAAEIPVHAVFGNNDGDRYLLTRNALTRCRHISLHGMFGRIAVDGRQVAFMHDGIAAEDIAAGGRYHLVCYGHSHRYEEKRVGNALVINPGELLGKDDVPGFCIVDMETFVPRRMVLEQTG